MGSGGSQEAPGEPHPCVRPAGQPAGMESGSGFHRCTARCPQVPPALSMLLFLLKSKSDSCVPCRSHCQLPVALGWGGTASSVTCCHSLPSSSFLIYHQPALPRLLCWSCSLASCRPFSWCQSCLPPRSLSGSSGVGRSGALAFPLPRPTSGPRCVPVALRALPSTQCVLRLGPNPGRQQSPRPPWGLTGGVPRPRPADSEAAEGFSHLLELDHSLGLCDPVGSEW